MRKLQLMVIAVLVGGGAAVAGCGPSIDPALKADIDRRNSALGPPAQTFPRPTEFAPQPLQVGQWTQHRIVRDKEPSFLTYKVVGQISDAFWVESVFESYTGRTVTKILLALPNRMDPNSIEIRGVVMKDRNGHVNSFDGPMLQMMQGMYRGTVANLIVTWQGQPQEDAAVPAGKFTGCFKMRTDAQWGPWKTASTTWSHPTVPLSGMVRSEGIDHPTSTELIAFGLSGAVSEL